MFFFSLNFLLFGGWGIIALFYSIAYLIVLLTKFIENDAKPNAISTQLIKLSNLIAKKEMITEDEFNTIKGQLLINKL